MTARKDLIMEYYIAYGSNLNVEQMKLRCPGAKVYKKALMKGWKLTFRRTYLNIEPDEKLVHRCRDMENHETGRAESRPVRGISEAL